MTDPLPLFSLIVPTFNESENILSLLTSVHQSLGSQPYEILVIDDASPDGTAERVSAFGREHPWVRVEKRLNARGLSSAVMMGFELARGEWLGVMDADL